MTRRAASLTIALAAALVAAGAAIGQEAAVPQPQPRPQTSAPAETAATSPETTTVPTVQEPGDDAPVTGASEAQPLAPPGPLPQDQAQPPATGAKPAKGGINPDRFGAKPPDAAYGAFQRGLYVTAYNLAMVRAKKGDPAAQTLVAEILSRGLGMPLNNVEAAKWYQLAAEQGIPEAQFQYALMLLDGTYVEKDVNGAWALLEAAAEAGNVLAQFNFAQLIVDREPGEAGMAKAVAYYERAAKAGLADAQYAMAEVYANGVGGKKRDEKDARRWMELAARQGYDTAELELGTWMIQGRGGPKSMKSGFALLKRAALGGNVAAQNRLAKLYMQGIGTDPDEIMAAAWYIVAKRAGLSDPEMDDLLNGLTQDETKQALMKANRLR